MLKKLLGCLFLLIAPLLANTSDNKTITLKEAETLIQGGGAQVITKQELNRIKKSNIKIEIQELKKKKSSVIQNKKTEIDNIESQRAKELASINKKFDERRISVENKRNQEVSELKKMVLLKNKEIEMIDRLEKIATTAKKKKKEQMKLIVINDIKGLKSHIKEYKHINNVMMKLSLLDSLKMFHEAKKHKYNYGVLKRIKDYTLKVAFDNESIDYNAFEAVIKNGSNYDIEQIIKIFETERGY